MVASTPPEGYAACCEAIAAMDLRPVIGRITAPTLVIAGADDPATPPDLGRAIAAAVPGARFAPVANAAHLASHEQASTVNHLLLEHFS
jgi:3-oxoadipate enol-lactonase